MNKKIRKILLVVPPALTFKGTRDINPLPPMGLGYLASVVDGMGIEVKILDCLVRGWDTVEEIDGTLIRVGLSSPEIEEYIKEYNPDLVGINCQFSRQYKIYHQLFSLIKKVKPDCITIGGGPHVTVCPEEVLNDQNCDFIIIGEGEESFTQFITALRSGNGFALIDGFGWKEDGRIKINPKTRWIKDLDSIPFPAYHLMGLQRYYGLSASHGTRHKAKFSPIMTSRGCPARCVFCSANKVWGKNYRIRSVDNVLAEMRLLKERYGIEELMFEDDNVTANPKRAKELFSRMIQEGFNFTWDTPNGVGVWSLTNELIDIMKESGCVKLNFPVESGSQRVLNDIIRKPLVLSKVKKLIQHCKKINLDCSMFLVVGLPGETIEDIWSSIRFAADCGCYNPHISVATPYPGTELHNICVKDHLFANEFQLDDLFIRSYMIKTSLWDEKKLRQTLFRAKLYLKGRELFASPLSFFQQVSKATRKPSKIVSYLSH